MTEPNELIRLLEKSDKPLFINDFVQSFPDVPPPFVAAMAGAFSGKQSNYHDGKRACAKLFN